MILYVFINRINDDDDDDDGKADNMSIYTLPNLWRSATAVLYKIYQSLALLMLCYVVLYNIYQCRFAPLYIRSSNCLATQHLQLDLPIRYNHTHPVNTYIYKIVALNQLIKLSRTFCLKLILESECFSWVEFKLTQTRSIIQNFASHTMKHMLLASC